ncbi:uncharacterized protein TNCV_4986781 [Trichonephila clavipes]|nr:uncharacterized protein TNCV_4986781 [Trichonephila clavipes]
MPFRSRSNFHFQLHHKFAVELVNSVLEYHGIDFKISHDHLFLLRDTSIFTNGHKRHLSNLLENCYMKHFCTEVDNTLGRRMCFEDVVRYFETLRCGYNRSKDRFLFYVSVACVAAIAFNNEYFEAPYHAVRIIFQESLNVYLNSEPPRQDSLVLSGKRDLQHRVAAVGEWYRHRIVAGFVTSSSPVPLKTRRVGQRCTLNLSRVETSSRWCGVAVRRGGASSGVVHVT